MLHGWGMNAAVWDACPPQCWQGLTQHPIELPGHGHRRSSPPPNSLWGWAETCLEATPEGALWLGWSLGGLVALAAALSAPARIAGLILLTATPRFVRAADWTPAMPEPTLEQFHTELLADPAGTLSRFLALQVRGSETARENLRTLRLGLASRPRPDPAALALGLDLLRNEDVRGRLPDIRCPTLWLFGSRDTLVPPAVAERIELLMPGAVTRVVQGAAHAPHLSHPSETGAAIRSFLNAMRVRS